MVNFVVVEDNKLHYDITKKIIVSYMMKNDYEFNVIRFESFGKELDNFMKTSEDNNIYIFDFDLGKFTGLEVARMLRMYDWRSPIIVYSVINNVQYETYRQRIQVLDFVHKGVNAEKEFNELFDICFKQLGLRRAFCYKTNKVIYSIDYNSILYIYKDAIERKSVFVLDNSEVVVNLSLGEVKKKLGKEFKVTSKSYIVNSRRVRLFDWSNFRVIFDNDREENLLSRTHKKELMEECTY